MCFLAVIFSYLSLFSYASASTDLSAQMLENNKRVHSLISELIQIAEHRVSNKIRGQEKELNENIKNILNRENDSDVLAGFALALPGYSFRSEAGTEPVFLVYVVAWDQAIIRIEELGGRKALSNLEVMRGLSRYDGAFSLRVNLAIDRLKAKLEQEDSEKKP